MSKSALHSGPNAIQTGVASDVEVLMITNSRPQGQIVFIEFHDAEVDAVVVHMNGASSIHFTHLPVYHERAQEKFELWP